MIIDNWKDKCIEQRITMDELYQRIFDLEEMLHKEEDRFQELVKFLSHSSLSIEDMEKVGELVNE